MDYDIPSSVFSIMQTIRALFYHTTEDPAFLTWSPREDSGTVCNYRNSYHEFKYERSSLLFADLGPKGMKTRIIWCVFCVQFD